MPCPMAKRINRDEMGIADHKQLKQFLRNINNEGPRRNERQCERVRPSYQFLIHLLSLSLRWLRKVSIPESLIFLQFFFPRLHEIYVSLFIMVARRSRTRVYLIPARTRYFAWDAKIHFIQAFKRQNLGNRDIDAKIDFIHIRDAWYGAFRRSCIREHRDFPGILLWNRTEENPVGMSIRAEEKSPAEQGAREQTRFPRRCAVAKSPSTTPRENVNRRIERLSKPGADIRNGIPIPAITVRMAHANPRPLGIISRTEIPADSGSGRDRRGISAGIIDLKFTADLWDSAW